ncbi:MAG: CsiV family protein [Gammaproteobacteria bacterium]|nr:CsiV family protein [Gammaproteobacteria bacterium]
MSRVAAHLVAIAFTSGALADIEEHLEHDWYYVETLFFRHAAPPGDEDFTRQGTPHHRLRLAALEPAPPEYLERIAATPPEPSDFPRLAQFDCIAPIPAPWMRDDAEFAPQPDPAGKQEDENPPEVTRAPIPTGPPTPTPEQLARWALDEFEDGLMREGWRWQYDDLSLKTAAIRMRRSGNYEVLHHGKWLQAVPPRDRAEPLLIQAGAQMTDATFELEGSVSVTLGRYLHFAAELWLRQTPEASPSALSPETGANTPGNARGSTIDNARYVALSESRRMRRDEIHHLDHPWLGVLVRIEPTEAPDALLEQLESLPDFNR